MKAMTDAEWSWIVALALRWNALILGYTTARGTYVALLPRALWQRGVLA